MGIFHVKREKRAAFVRDGDAGRQRLLSLVVGHAEDQGGLVQRFLGRAGIEFDFADLDVVPLFWWNDRQCVLAFEQRAGRHGERLNQVLLREKQLAQFAPVQFDGPIQLHIALADEQRVFVRVR